MITWADGAHKNRRIIDTMVEFYRTLSTLNNPNIFDEILDQILQLVTPDMNLELEKKNSQQ